MSKDSRVQALYLSGSSSADEYSDVDLSIICEEKDQKSLLDDRYKIAEQVSKLKSAAIPPVSDEMLVVCYDKEEIKVDYSYSKLPLKTRPDRAFIEILFDPHGLLKKMVEDSEKLEWEIDLEFLKNRIKHHFMGFSYTVTKFGRGELWDGQDCIDWYRKNLVMFEDVLAQRKQENFRRLENKLDKKRLELFEQTLVKEITRKELFRAMDVVNLYFETFLKQKLIDLGVYHKESEENMMEFYERKKKEILGKS
ncbi:MAG: hypothetical protein H7645_01415 [Candidatus Heimdallarchaeota archaeon]|nr:hypothetical protein [Candidatus Heimdallarchaeota archaeon]MCK4768974.1 hypothetical protein [Candidatus Heimdallarchaeota archaeon]